MARPLYLVLSVHPRVKLLSCHDGWDAHGKAFTAYRLAGPSAALAKLETGTPMSFGWGEQASLTVLAAKGLYTANALQSSERLKAAVLDLLRWGSTRRRGDA